MKMIVGLGNIGREYDRTRHNVGFIVLDALADKYDLTFKQDSEHHAFVANWFFNGEKVLLVKPTTFMNDSGRAVRPLMDYYKIELEDILIVHDDMDMDLGKIRLRAKGSAGGHNGIKSIANHLNTQNFNRLKFGISHPKHTHQAVIDFVLGKFGEDEQVELAAGVDKSLDIFEDFAAGDDIQTLMNHYN
ncbi:aminoacyl-tRNA hydrolase [Weissella viridescens]|uniref:aminoacyl-tRNA hydrolase n=1 Tax=Weissella viridescens TaxID=1629 RepID=UPI00257653C1|nr:aminoacyl-tRNA hydrolase [Weissella viridescens]WJI91132.1 aminoacyl-tRNA hydrolase [Weissella viridescens]